MSSQCLVATLLHADRRARAAFDFWQVRLLLKQRLARSLSRARARAAVVLS